MFEARFQSFDDSSERAESARRVAALRAELKRRGLDGFVVPRADRQQNEYLPASEERLAWLTGFTGSAGVAIVLAERAALFVDGRYTVQAARRSMRAYFPSSIWWTTRPSNGSSRISKAAPSSATIRGCTQPTMPRSCERPAPMPAPRWCRSTTIRSTRCGPTALRRPPGRWCCAISSSPAKAPPTNSNASALRSAKLRADLLVVSDPQNVAWAFNIRGADVAHTPLALAFAIVPKDGRPALYVEAKKLDNTVRHALEEFADVRAPDDLARDLSTLKDKTVRLDQASAADALTRLVTDSGGKPVRGADPIALMKAVKNQAEIAGSRAAHKRDGVAMVRFLAWFDHEAASGKLTEIDAVAALESFRRDTGVLKDISFPTIAG